VALMVQDEAINSVCMRTCMENPNHNCEVSTGAVWAGFGVRCAAGIILQIWALLEQLRGVLL